MPTDIKNLLGIIGFKQGIRSGLNLHWPIKDINIDQTFAQIFLYQIFNQRKWTENIF